MIRTCTHAHTDTQAQRHMQHNKCTHAICRTPPRKWQSQCGLEVSPQTHWTEEDTPNTSYKSRVEAVGQLCARGAATLTASGWGRASHAYCPPTHTRHDEMQEHGSRNRIRGVHATLRLFHESRGRIIVQVAPRSDKNLNAPPARARIVRSCPERLPDPPLSLHPSVNSEVGSGGPENGL